MTTPEFFGTDLPFSKCIEWYWVFENDRSVLKDFDVVTRRVRSYILYSNQKRFSLPEVHQLPGPLPDLQRRQLLQSQEVAETWLQGVPEENFQVGINASV